MISLERNRLTKLIKILMSHCASPDTFFNFFVIFQCLIVMTLNFVERSCVKISFLDSFDKGTIDYVLNRVNDDSKVTK